MPRTISTSRILERHLKLQVLAVEPFYRAKLKRPVRAVDTKPPAVNPSRHMRRCTNERTESSLKRENRRSACTAPHRIARSVAYQWHGGHEPSIG